MDAQTLINICIGLAVPIGGWVMKLLQDSIKASHEANANLSDKVHSMEILVAGHYVQKSDLEKLTAALFSKLDKIEDKLDKKADK